MAGSFQCRNRNPVDKEIRDSAKDKSRLVQYREGREQEVFEGEPTALTHPELLEMEWYDGHNNSIAGIITPSQQLPSMTTPSSKSKWILCCDTSYSGDTIWYKHNNTKKSESNIIMLHPLTPSSKGSTPPPHGGVHPRGSLRNPEILLWRL